MHRDDEHLLDQPGFVRWLLRSLYIACGALLLVEIPLHRHAERDWEGLWGFYSAYGFVGCVVLVLIAKWLRTVLKRPEDYYESDDGKREGAQDQND